MIKHIILGVGIIIVLLVVLEISALLHLKNSIPKFAAYWNQHNDISTGSFTYVALGDSTAQGIGAGNPQDSYAGILAKRIANQTGQRVRFINLSVSGAKINDVITQQLPQLKKYKPDLVTVEAGANNIPHYDAAQFRMQFNDLAKQLPTGTYVSDMPYFGGRIRANAQALAANKDIDDIIAAHHLREVHLQSFTHKRQSIRNYAADGFHPSSRSYVNWADAFWSVIQPNLTQN